MADTLAEQQDERCCPCSVFQRPFWQPRQPLLAEEALSDVSLPAATPPPPPAPPVQDCMAPSVEKPAAETMVAAGGGDAVISLSAASSPRVEVSSPKRSSSCGVGSPRCPALSREPSEVTRVPEDDEAIVSMNSGDSDSVVSIEISPEEEQRLEDKDETDADDAEAWKDTFSPSLRIRWSWADRRMSLGGLRSGARRNPFGWSRGRLPVQLAETLEAETAKGDGRRVRLLTADDKVNSGRDLVFESSGAAARWLRQQLARHQAIATTN
eukprot:TRINITY_DN8247_c0_g2_i1.p1 TRINITY_DN8247_c0_g2~~TRINITY_DN8247_c0_g2_i1.p1  ORF type:complete len:268 (+),score=74.43 TRINITY_DN8247_c0_g2_i1:86-889(+)